MLLSPYHNPHHRRGSALSYSPSVSPATGEEEFDDDGEEEQTEEDDDTPGDEEQTEDDEEEDEPPPQVDCSLMSPHFCKVLNPGYGNWKY